MDADHPKNGVLIARRFTRFGTPTIFNTGQGSQFTSAAFVGVLAGKGMWRDNVFVERLWRTIKYE